MATLPAIARNRILRAITVSVVQLYAQPNLEARNCPQPDLAGYDTRSHMVVGHPTMCWIPEVEDNCNEAFVNTECDMATLPAIARNRILRAMTPGWRWNAGWSPCYNSHQEM